MKMLNLRRRAAAAMLTASLALTGTGLTPVHSQNSVRNEIAKHPTATAVVAGVATTKMLERKARWDRAHGRRLSWAERHPRLSGVAVAIVAHHEIKKHMHPAQ